MSRARTGVVWTSAARRKEPLPPEIFTEAGTVDAPDAHAMQHPTSGLVVAGWSRLPDRFYYATFSCEKMPLAVVNFEWSDLD